MISDETTKNRIDEQMERSKQALDASYAAMKEAFYLAPGSSDDSLGEWDQGKIKNYYEIILTQVSSWVEDWKLPIQ